MNICERSRSIIAARGACISLRSQTVCCLNVRCVSVRSPQQYLLDVSKPRSIVTHVERDRQVLRLGNHVLNLMLSALPHFPSVTSQCQLRCRACGSLLPRGTFRASFGSVAYVHALEVYVSLGGTTVSAVTKCRAEAVQAGTRSVIWLTS